MSPRRLVPLVFAVVAFAGCTSPPSATMTSAPTLPPVGQKVAGDDTVAFYQPPAALPPGDGVLIRSEPVTVALDPQRTSVLPAKAHRVLYTTRDDAGRRTVSSGVVLVPPSAGTAPLPVVGVAPATHGLADACAPSRRVESGQEYEALAWAPLLAQGYAVAVTDYVGIGTPGAHPYMHRRSMGQALLDVVRATRTVPGSRVTAASPVVLAGYSQGGAAAMGAAELSATYAPDVRIRGAFGGGTPSGSLRGFLAGQETVGGLGLMYLSSMVAVHGLPAEQWFTEKAVTALQTMQKLCVWDLHQAPDLSWKEALRMGLSPSSMLKDPTWEPLLSSQRLGTQRLPAVGYLSHSRHDDVIPFADATQLAERWCALGSAVRFSANDAPGHGVAARTSAQEAATFAQQVFAGTSVPSDCGRLPG